MAYNENYTAIGDKIEAIGNFFSQNRFDSCVSTLNTHIKLFIFGWKKNKLKKKKVELSQCAQFHVTGVVNAGNFKVGNLLSIQFRFICVGWHIKLAHNRFISELIERNNKFKFIFCWLSSRTYRSPRMHSTFKLFLNRLCVTVRSHMRSTLVHTQLSSINNVIITIIVMRITKPIQFSFIQYFLSPFTETEMDWFYVLFDSTISLYTFSLHQCYSPLSIGTCKIICIDKHSVSQLETQGSEQDQYY